MTIAEGREFEGQVHRVAEALWPAARFGGATHIDGRERDGVYETDQSIYLVECTTSRQAAKAKSDGRKLKDTAEKLGRANPLKSVKGYSSPATAPPQTRTTRLKPSTRPPW